MRPADLAARWIEALNAHDLDRAAACFDPDYRDRSAAPDGSVASGRDDLRAAFLLLLRDAVDLRAELVSAVEDGGAVWVEWRMWGRRPDGSPIEFAGVNILGVEGGRFRWGRAYTEIHAGVPPGAAPFDGLPTAVAADARPAGQGCELCREIQTGSLIAAIRLRHSPDCPNATGGPASVEDAYGQVALRRTPD